MLQAGAMQVLIFLDNKDVTAREICRIRATLEEYGRQPLRMLDTSNADGLSALVVAEQDFVQQRGDFRVRPFDNLGRRTARVSKRARKELRGWLSTPSSSKMCVIP
jgi:hypothetical protein